jgi:dolichol-phosphate mannosyltransferase
MLASWQQRLVELLEWLKRFRYIKFGLVGASGTVVNLAVLYTAHEYLFRSIEAPGSKPYASLALAIAVSTINNFIWNRLWTWADRRHHLAAHSPEQGPAAGALLRQFGLYSLASWLGIALQYGLTLWLTNYLHYLLANVLAILIASVSNFLANDRWTFHRHKKSGS